MWEKNWEPLFIPPSFKMYIDTSIKNDADFLSNQNIMDYSLLVGKNKTDLTLVLGIVDFVGVYSWYKRLEHTGKTLIVNRECTIQPPVMYKDRFIKFMDEAFVMVPDKDFDPSLIEEFPQVL